MRLRPLRTSRRELAPFVGAKTGAEIVAYENDEDDLLVSVLFGYAKLAGIPILFNSPNSTPKK